VHLDWLSLHDRRRATPADRAIEGILHQMGLRVVNQPDIATHESGSILDMIAVTSGLMNHNGVQVDRELTSAIRSDH
jgi:hypothetical protein